jgi:hypothetical protein
MGAGESKPEGIGEMHKRRTTLEDGRYLIYYTFGDEADGARRGAEVVGSKPEAEAKPEAEEERGV